MHEAEAIWNLLHDGSVEAISSVDKRVTFRVNISYLRDLFSPPGDGFDVQLSECAGFEFERWGVDDGVVSHDLQALAELEPEVLSADITEHGLVQVLWNGGVFRLSYSGVSLRLDTGEVLSITQLTQAAAAYWQRFEERR